MDTKRMNFVYFLSDCIIMGLCYILFVNIFLYMYGQSKQEIPFAFSI